MSGVGWGRWVFGWWWIQGEGYRARCILSLHVDSEQESGWSPERVTERKRAGVGGILPLVWRSVPSPAHVHDEVMRDPGPLTNSGQMGRGFFPTITLQQRELEPVQLVFWEKIITASFRRILNQQFYSTLYSLEAVFKYFSCVIFLYPWIQCPNIQPCPNSTHNKTTTSWFWEVFFTNLH